jgi:L-ascorbate metabolism protein UlaG (beta-lactamase superfamily)
MWNDVRAHVRRVNHDCFRFEGGGLVVYTDPFKVQGAPHDADLVLVSHEHFDHLSPDDLDRVVKRDAVIVAAETCRGKVTGDVRYVKPGASVEAKGVTIKAVPAYNVDKKFHPKSAGHVGYVFTLDGTTVYFAGDTDLIAEMADVKADVALLPVSGTYVMTAREAVDAATRIKARVVIPMHYGDIIGTAKDAKFLEDHWAGGTVIIL